MFVCVCIYVGMCKMTIASFFLKGYLCWLQSLHDREKTSFRTEAPIKMEIITIALS